MARKITVKTEEEVYENVCAKCNGTGRGPLEGFKETTCQACEGRGLPVTK